MVKDCGQKKNKYTDNCGQCSSGCWCEAGVGADEALITISKTITDITLPRIAIYRIEQNQTIPTIIDNIGYPAYRFICLIAL